MILSAMFEASITIVRQVSAEGKALGHISCTESHMTSVARFEEGCECEAKMASRQPAGRRRYRCNSRRQSNNFRMLE
jgi:hypothetical protein